MLHLTCCCCLLVSAVLQPRVAATEVVATWSELARCPYIKETKTIIHPGEVNKIREVAECPDVVVTHTDAPELYVWNTATQPHMTKEKVQWGQVKTLFCAGLLAVACSCYDNQTSSLSRSWVHVTRCRTLQQFKTWVKPSSTACSKPAGSSIGLLRMGSWLLW